MSLARVNRAKSRKPWVCGRCNNAIAIGEENLSFAVGFRGFTQRRCTRPECHPTPSQLESSAVANVYAAIEGTDLASCTTLDELEDAVQQVVDAATEVAEEYQASEMFEVNTDLQERAEMLDGAAQDLESWADSLDEEPSEEPEQVDCEECDEGKVRVHPDNNAVDCSNCQGTGQVDDPDAKSHDEWLEEARSAAQEAIDGMELP
jgi:hypothetical protein